ncbi:unnamed protein product [Clonostachys rosea]|uniref:Protein kinase domain-containing protein n=1 Tax=Bionectria ochroleuca TaxID=29856 RepID=A0ABY6TRZ9_BIOOC|nr:unnamed protein product [Clonostachys rosea]
MEESPIKSGEVLRYEVIKELFANRYPQNDERSDFYKEFLPAGSIAGLVTKESVVKTLEDEDCSADDIDSLGTYVFTHAPKVFLILAYLNLAKAKHIRQFKERDFKDEHLPVTVLSENPPILKSSTNDIRVEFDVGSVKRGDFADYQWKFLAPKFVIDTFQSAKYDQGQIFPYIHPEQAVMPHTGGFSEVRKVVLHKDHREGQSPYHVGRALAEGPIDPENEFTVALKILKTNQFTNVDKFYEKELITLEEMTKIGHDHLIKAISAYRRGNEKYFLFPWARGGNLRDIWNKESNSAGNVVTWALRQMVGLTEGISSLHLKNVRHGDIKPENILFFSENGTGSHFSGPLVIADVGLAKFHEKYTINREIRTTTNSRTICYEPPELTTSPNSPVSRNYDLWSLGCVFLEFLIWIRFGNSELQKFAKEISPTVGQGRFWKQVKERRFWKKTTGITAKVHPTVDRWIKDLKKSPEPHGTLVSKLADLIVRHLLVINKDKRDSNAFLQGLKPIQSSPDAASNPNYEATSSLAKAEPLSNIPANRSNQNTAQLNDLWKNVTDEKFVRSILKDLVWATLRPKSETQSLCSSCKMIDFQLPEIKLDLDIAYIAQQKGDCALCSVLSQSISDIDTSLSGTVMLFRDDEFHTIRLGCRGPPIFSLYSDPGMCFRLCLGDDIDIYIIIDYSPNAPPYAQIGLPVLPVAETSAFYRLINTWITVCDKSHDCLSRKADASSQDGMPTRVICVENDELRLLETNENMTEPYIALSHCWGKPVHGNGLTLNTDNLADFKNTIPYSKLPKSFQDAVRITRALHVSYLWIDSLCIIQDDGKDWEREARRMEYVFSSAYCTIAATSASSSTQGFLRQRRPRSCVTVKTGAGPLYLAPFIDNFKKDVEEGVLNSRGWVLQERALSRRTIHFTSTQMYWECGGGIQCETLAQLRNPQSQIIGDAEFPNSGLKYYKDERIRLVQYLYQVYCALGLTNCMDRSKAVLGLETRLAQAFESTAKYGIIWKFFERTILWQAATPGSLTRILYSKEARVPTWSWMAYTGNIRFIDVPFGFVTWLPSIHNRSEDASIGKAWDGSLIAEANDLVIDGPDLDKRITLDAQRNAYDTSTWKSVVLGRGTVKLKPSGELPHYVILVRQLSSGKELDDYERVGVGVLEQSHFSSSSIKVRLI